MVNTVGKKFFSFNYLTLLFFDINDVINNTPKVLIFETPSFLYATISHWLISSEKVQLLS